MERAEPVRILYVGGSLLVLIARDLLTEKTIFNFLFSLYTFVLECWNPDDRATIDVKRIEPLTYMFDVESISCVVYFVVHNT